MQLRRGLNRLYVVLALIWTFDVLVGEPWREVREYANKATSMAAEVNAFAANHARSDATDFEREDTRRRVESGRQVVSYYHQQGTYRAVYRRLFRVWWLPLVWALVPPIIAYLPLRFIGELVGWVVRGFLSPTRTTQRIT